MDSAAGSCPPSPHPHPTPQKSLRRFAVLPAASDDDVVSRPTRLPAGRAQVIPSIGNGYLATSDTSPLVNTLTLFNQVLTCLTSA